MVMNPLLETIERILTLSGGLVEPTGDGALEVIAPTALAGALKLPEHVTIYTDPLTAPQGGLVLSYTPELLEQLSAVLDHRGLLAQCILQGLYLKSSGVRVAAEGAFTVLNGIGSVDDYHEEMIPYVVCHFHYTALSDERTEGIVSSAINEFSGGTATDLSMVLLSQLSTARPGGLSAHGKPFAQVYRVACRSAQERVEYELAPFRRSLSRRLERDVSRVRDYYEVLVTEIERKIDRKSLKGSEKDAEEERIRAIRVELSRKALDVQERYAMEVKVCFINAVRIYVPALVVQYSVQRRRSARSIPLIWSPLRKDFEDIICEGCEKGVRSFFLCDEHLHVVCAGCFRCLQCGKTSCQACHRTRCPKCGGPGKPENTR